jgi:hypothetical protein
MDVGLLESWLRRQLRRDANFCLMLSPLAILAAIAVLVFTFGFTYVVVAMVADIVLAIPSLILDARWKLGHSGRLWIAGTFIGLLLISYWRSDRRPVDYGQWDEEPSTLGQGLARFGASSGRAGLLLAYPEMTAGIVVDLLETGPRLLYAGVYLLRESGGARAADSMAGARVLWTLLQQPGKTAYGELSQLYPAPELRAAFEALRRIHGVVFLETGISLADELRLELQKATRTEVPSEHS